MAPGLRRQLDLEPEEERELVVVQPPGRADVDEQPVDLPPLEPGVGERRRNGAVRHRREALLREVAAADRAEPDDRDGGERAHGWRGSRADALSSPSVGAGRRIVAGVRDSFTGIPAVRTEPTPVSTTISRARA